MAFGQHLPQRFQNNVVPRVPLLHLYLIFYLDGCYGMRLYDNAAHDFFYFSDWTHQINHKLSSLQRTHEVIVLEIALKLDLWVCVNSLAVHFVGQPLALVVALVRPGVGALALSVSVLELAFVDVAVRKYVET